MNSGTKNLWTLQFVLLSFLLSFFFVTSFITGDEIRVNIEGVLIFPSGATEEANQNTRLAVNVGDERGVYSIPIDGRFTIPDLTEGEHLLEVRHPTHHYSPVLIVVSTVPSLRISAYIFDFEMGIIFLMQRIQASIDPEELENVLGGDEPKYRSPFIEKLKPSLTTDQESQQQQEQQRQQQRQQQARDRKNTTTNTSFSGNSLEQRTQKDSSFRKRKK